MKKSDGYGGCLSRESLGILAIRIAQGAGDPGAPGKGSPESLPVDLFMPEEGGMRLHLESCAFCRKRLLEEVFSIRRYLDGLDNPENDRRFDELMEKIRIRDRAEQSSYIETVLVFAPYGDEKEESALAAASDPGSSQPLRFSSENGSMILREFPGGAEGTCLLRLFTDRPGLTGYAELYIGENKYCTDSEGVLEIESSAIDKEAVIRVRSRQC